MVLQRDQIINRACAPDDWLALTLHDVPRTLLPRKDVHYTRGTPPSKEFLDGFFSVICQSLEEGFFHFRFNSLYPPFNMPLGIRHLIDPLLHASVVSTILSSDCERGDPFGAAKAWVMPLVTHRGLGISECGTRFSPVTDST
jgi:hypothetical protein